MSAERAKSKSRGKKNAVREMPEEDPEFQIAPMIDVLLVLLVFFMSISSTEVLQSNQNITLAVAASANDKATGVNGQVTINVAWSALEAGSIEVSGHDYPTPADLTPMLADRYKANDKTRVLIRADKRTQYSFLRGVMLAVGNARIGNVTFSVVDKDTPK